MTDTGPPDQPPTIRLDAVQVLSELIRGVSNEVTAARAETGHRFDAIDTRLGGLEGAEKTLSDTVSRLVTDVEHLQNTDRRHDEDVRRLSDRAKSPSSSDLAIEAKLAVEIEARNALARDLATVKAETSAQTLMLRQLVKLTEKPVVKLAITAIATAILTWLASRGISVK
jgi:hypothetical protein